MKTEQLIFDHYASPERKPVRSETTASKIGSPDHTPSPKPRKGNHSPRGPQSQYQTDGMVHRRPRKRGGTLYRLQQQIFLRDAYTCQYCGQKPDKPIAEHILPKRRSGPNEAFNLTTACSRCNILKGNLVWIPKNLDQITEGREDWREKIKTLAAVDTEDKPTYPRWSIRADLNERIIMKVFSHEEAIAAATGLISEGATWVEFRMFEAPGSWSNPRKSTITKRKTTR